MNRGVACILVAAAVAACASDQSRAEKLEERAASSMNSGDARGAVHLYDEAIRIKPSKKAYLGRAAALVAAGDRAQAVESLADCDDETCRERRAELAREAIRALGNRPVTDPASLKKYLGLQHAAGTSGACALTLATASASVEGAPTMDAALNKAFVAAFDAEIVRAKGRLNGMELDDPQLENAQGFGSAVAGETGCSALEKAGDELGQVARVAANIAGEQGAAIYNEQAHRAAMTIGFLKAKRDLVSRGPVPATSKDWKNGGPCAGVAQLEIGQSCKTSRGALAKREKRGEISGTRLNGVFWSDHLSETYEPNGPTDQAAAACAKIRMRLPSKQDFVSLQRAFELQSPPPRDGARFSEDGIAEFHKVFRDATEFVWSSTKSKEGRWGFVSADGFLETAPGYYAQRVVCIAR